MDANSSLVFDKVAINDLMRTVIGRLRKQKITIPDIIAQLNANGIVISRAKFNDWFMTRSERDATAPIAVLHAVIDVLYALQPHIMTATELFSLLIATRMPINLIHAYAPTSPKKNGTRCSDCTGFTIIYGMMQSLVKKKSFSKRIGISLPVNAKSL
jgi:hypothetical protein